MAKGLKVGLFALVLLATPYSALSDDQNTVSGDKGTDMLVDAVVMRPPGLVAPVLGAAVTLVTLPFTLPSGNVDEAARYMIVKPAEYSFNRPLGDFHHCGASDR